MRKLFVVIAFIASVIQTQNLKAQHLKYGDTVALIAPSFSVKKADIDYTREQLCKLGLESKLFVSELDTFGYYSGEKENRINQIESAFKDKSTKAIMCIRGGYGAIEILDHIDYKTINKHPKPFIGFSDITAYLWAFYKKNPKNDLPLFHAPVGKTLDDGYAIQSFSELLMGDTKKLLIKRPDTFEIIEIENKLYADTIYNGGKAEGIGIGGNLSVIVSMIGTPWEMDFRDKIVFIEDIDEKPYKIDKMLTQLKLASNINKAKGIVFGIFDECNQNGFTVQEIIARVFKELKMPMAYGMPIGHISKNATLPYGKMYYWDASKMELEIKM